MMAIWEQLYVENENPDEQNAKGQTSAQKTKDAVPRSQSKSKQLVIAHPPWTYQHYIAFDATRKSLTAMEL